MSKKQDEIKARREKSSKLLSQISSKLGFSGSTAAYFEDTIVGYRTIRKKGKLSQHTTQDLGYKHTYAKIEKFAKLVLENKDKEAMKLYRRKVAKSRNYKATKRFATANDTLRDVIQLGIRSELYHENEELFLDYSAETDSDRKTKLRKKIGDLYDSKLADFLTGND